MVRGTFFAAGGAGGWAAGPFVCVCAIVMMPVGMTAASSSAGSVSLFILSPFNIRVSESVCGESFKFAADYRTTVARALSERVCVTQSAPLLSHGPARLTLAVLLHAARGGCTLSANVRAKV